MAHMPTVAQPSAGTGTSAALTVLYTATGAEGTSFDVSIGEELAAADYYVSYAPQGVSNFPLVDLPTTGRTTTTFPVVLAAALTAGEQLLFVVYQ
jgi:hypothetical protein